MSVTPPSADGFYRSGAVVTIEAKPNAGQQFSSWYIGYPSAPNPLTVGVSAPVSLAARFVPAQCTVTVGPSATGTYAALPAGGVVSLSVTTSKAGCPWTASTGATWLSVTPASGTESGTLSVNVLPNTTGLPRSASVSVAGAAPVTITQESQCLPVRISPSSMSFPSAAGSQVLKLSATSTSCAWQIGVPSGSWATPSTLQGTGSADVWVNVTANSSTASRQTSLSVYGTGSEKPVIVDISQSAPATCNAPAFSPAQLSFPASGGTLQVQLNTTASTCSWAFAVKGNEWARPSPAQGSGSATVTITAAENRSPNNRQLTLSLSGYSSSITVTQAGRQK